MGSQGELTLYFESYGDNSDGALQIPSRAFVKWNDGTARGGLAEPAVEDINKNQNQTQMTGILRFEDVPEGMPLYFTYSWRELRDVEEEEEEEEISVGISRGQSGSVGFSRVQSGSVGFSRVQSGSVGFSRDQSGSVGVSRVQSGSVGLSRESGSVGSRGQSGLVESRGQSGSEELLMRTG